MNQLYILGEGDVLIWALVGFLFLCALVFFAIFARYFGLWIQSKFTRADIGFVDLVFMSFRKVNPSVIVRSKIMAVQAGLTRQYPISKQALEAHYLSLIHI